MLSSQTSETTSDIPTLPSLLEFPGKNGNINFAEKIGNNGTFRILLLDDQDGSKIDAIRTEYRDKADTINLEVLSQWIKGRGKKPVNWSTFAKVLRNSGDNSLAEIVESSTRND